jgi:predicted dithiol-disulfide oxidoreductase (DUF899 family)
MKGPLEKESEAYRRARAELLEAEIALRDQCERVAALRRKLPVETEVEDYMLEEGPAELEKEGPFAKVRLSGLFADVNKPLVVYQYMYGAAQKKPCPMCTLWIDGFNGVAGTGCGWCRALVQISKQTCIIRMPTAASTPASAFSSDRRRAR